MMQQRDTVKQPLAVAIIEAHTSTDGYHCTTSFWHVKGMQWVRAEAGPERLKLQWLSQTIKEGGKLACSQRGEKQQAAASPIP